MKLSDYMEIVVVDKKGMHKIENTEEIERWLDGRPGYIPDSQTTPGE